MKKKYQYVPLLTTLIAVIFSLTSCSKEQVVNSKVPAATTQGPVDGKVFPVKGGSVMLQVLPEDANPIVTIVNENFSSKDFYIIKGGYLRLDNVPSGIYKLVIHPQNPAILYGDSPVTPDDPGYPDMVISNVKIASGVITNLGTIKLN